MKKLATIQLIALITAVTLAVAACGNSSPPAGADGGGQPTAAADKTAEPAEEGDGYYELTLYVDELEGGDVMAESNSFRQTVKEKFNIGYKIVMFPGDLAEFASLKLASGDYPDIVRVVNPTIFRSYLDANALLPLDDLMDEYAPGFKKLNEVNLPIWESFSGLDDGKVYVYTGGLPSDTRTYSEPLMEFLIRSDVLEQQGYPELKNIETWMQICKQGAADNPETNGKPTIGISFPMAAWGTTGIQTVSSFFRSNPCYDTQLSQLDCVYDWTQGKYIDHKIGSVYKAGMKAWNTAWRENILDKESPTLDYDTFWEKMKEGRVIGIYFLGAWGFQDLNVILTQEGAPYRYIPIPLVLEEHQKQKLPKIALNLVGGIWGGYGISNQAKHPDRIMKLIEFTNSEEGMILDGWGVEGVQYTVDSSGLRVPTAEHLEKMAADPNYKKTWGSQLDGLFGQRHVKSANGQNGYYLYDESTFLAGLDPKILEVWGHYGWKTLRDTYAKNPNFVLDDTKFEDFKKVPPVYSEDDLALTQKMLAKTDEYTLALITAESEGEFERIFNEFVDFRLKSGVAPLIENATKNYHEMAAKYGVTP